MPPRPRVAIVVSLQYAFKRHQEVFAGAYRYARQRGWQVDFMSFSSQILGMARKGVRYSGVIARVDPQLAAYARNAGVPLVNVWYSSPVQSIPLVAPDHRRAGELAADHLRDRGFRRFAYLGYTVKSSTELEEGFRETAGQGATAYSRLRTRLDYGDSAAAFVRFEKQLGDWLKSLTLPVGVFVGDDQLARHLINAASLRGISVPADMAVVGTFNEELFCRSCEPTITSIDLGYDRIGYRAGKVLDELMKRQPVDAVPLLLPPRELIPRDSTDVFASGDPLVASALRYISDNCHKPINVNDVVARLPTCGRTLARHFKKERGCRVIDELLRMRITRAKRLLVEGDTPIKLVASQCGFASGSQFVVAFRRLENMTPSEFRARQ